MLGTWLEATAEDIRGPQGDRTEDKGSQLLSTGLYPADHQKCGPCNISHQSHMFTKEVIEFRKNEFQERLIYPP